jgi:adenylate cyclase
MARVALSAAGPEACMAKILIITPEGQSERDLAANNSLGRHPNNSIQLLDRVVSKEHCLIDARANRFVLRDLGSLNGTYINGQRVAGEQMLRNGDEVSLGNTRLVFLDPNEASATSGEVSGPGVYRVAHQGHNPPTSPFGSGTPGGTPSVQPGQQPRPPGAPGAPGDPSPTDPSAQPASPTGVVNLTQSRSKVTIAAGMMESHIRSKIAAEAQQFLPEKSITDVEALRRDYEKLRTSYELGRAIGLELDLDKLLDKILERAFDLLAADRGVILLYDEGKELKPRAVRSRRANSDENFVVSTSIIKQVEREKVAVLSSDAMLDPRFSQAHSIIMQGIRSSMAVPLMHKNDLLGIMVLDSQISTNAFGDKDLQLFTNIANQAALFIENATLAKQSERDAIARERFQRLLSPQVAALVMEGKVEVKQGGDPRDTTMLFSDIRGFTSMSEGMRAEEIVSMLNLYFERMVEIIFRHEGTLDKFVGDEIMALFGAPVGHPDDAVRAVRTALEMLSVLRRFNQERAAENKRGFEIGIGINTGDVVAGYLGSSKAMQYTVIGAPVNLAARLCSQAKGMQVIISEPTWLRVKDNFEVRELEPVKPKGIGHPVRIFEVLRERGAESEFDDNDTMSRQVT